MLVGACSTLKRRRMQVIHLIRHGETENNRRGHVQGWTESPLSELGREQARRVGDRLRAGTIDAVVSSPLGRAVETARIAVGSGARVELRDGLREMNLGAWEGKSAAELRKTYPRDVALWFDRPSVLRIEGAETIRAFRRRVSGAMADIRGEYADQTLAVFVHGGVICAWLTHILGMKLDDIWRFKIRNGSFTRVIFPAGKPRVELLGDVSHLEGAERVVPPDAPRLFP
jgi:broad specificity phosphatase PhoE